MATKAKIKWMRLQQTKMILYNKGNHQQNEKANYEWEKIFVNHVSEKRLISGIYEELIGLKEETRQFNLKMEMENQYFVMYVIYTGKHLK